MKKTVALIACLCGFLLSACGNQPGRADIVGTEAWPSHAPGATPYVRLKNEAQAEREEEPDEHYNTYEELLRSMYAEEGDFYAKDWEMQMFRDLPQGEPYSFVVHTDVMLRGEDTLEEHILLAQKFADMGCAAKVKEMRAVYEGQEEIGWVTIVTTTPAHLWELSDRIGQRLHIEQLYPQVDARFEKTVWPEVQKSS